MTLLVQDNTGTVADAVSYVSVAEFKAYCIARGKSWGSSNDTAIEQALTRATDYVDGRFSFRGRRLNMNQTTAWPRAAAYDNDRRGINGIPRALKEAVSEYALRSLTTTINPDPARDENGRLIQSVSKGVGSLNKSVTYAPGVVHQSPIYPEADNKIKAAGLVESSGRMLRG